MKERFLDVIKWGLILIIAGAVFYVVCPKYYFPSKDGLVFIKCNKITGQVTEAPIVAEKDPKEKNRNVSKDEKKTEPINPDKIVWDDEKDQSNKLKGFCPGQSG